MADQFARPSYPLELPSYQDYAATAEESIAPDLWRGCVGLWVPALGRTGKFLQDLTHLSGDAISSETAWQTGPYGYELNIDGTDNRAHTVAIDSTHSLAGATDFSAVVICSASSHALSKGAISFRRLATTAGLLIFYPFDTDGGDGARVFIDGSVRENENTAPSGRADDISRVFVLTYDGATSRTYVDGIEVANASHTSTLRSDPTNIDIGRWRAGNQIFHGAISLTALYDRALPVEEVLSWARGPFDIVTPITRSPVGISVGAVDTISKIVGPGGLAGGHRLAGDGGGIAA